MIQVSRTKLASHLLLRTDLPTSDDHRGFVERLRVVIFRAGSARNLAQKTGVSPNTIGLWLKDSEPGRDKLVDLAKAASVSVEWLATGRGPMEAGQLPEGYITLPGLATAGTLGPLRYLAFNEEWIANLPGAPDRKDLQLTWAIGDAMAPTIQAGDVVMMNWKDRQIRDGVFGVIEHQGTEESPSWLKGRPILIRRIQSKADGTYVVLCDNPKYPVTETVDPKRKSRDDGRLYMRVIWAGGLRL